MGFFLVVGHASHTFAVKVVESVTADFPKPDRLMSSVMAMAQEAVDRVEALRAALQELEAANEAVCAGRSRAAYEAMIDGGQSDDLLRLDAARRHARELLA